MQKVCCVCAKTDNGSGWSREPLADYRRLSHGYCPDCYRRLMERINNLLRGGCPATNEGCAA